MKNFIAVHTEDAELIKQQEIPLPIVIIRAAAEGPEVWLGGALLPEHELYPGLLLGVALSEASRTDLDALAVHVASRFACDAPRIVDLTTMPEEKVHPEIASAIARALADEVRKQAERNVDLTRALASVRDAHSRTQAAFARLEQFVWNNALATRTESCTLQPAIECGEFLLSEDDGIEQRLSIASSGISDIGVFLSGTDASESGTLVASLSTMEDGEVHGSWQVPGASIGEGLLRLSLPVALGPEPLTPLLSLHWIGEGTVRLLAAMSHPDPRFQAHVSGRPDGRVLASRTWSYIAGCEAPIPAGAVLPVSTEVHLVRDRVIDRETLKNAVNLNTANQGFQFLEESDALMVHALESGVAAGVLPAIVPARTTHVRVQIQTRAEQAPVIEYALALAPASARVRPDEDLPLFAEGHVTPWVSLQALETGELHLPLAVPLDARHDLYVMTRLAGSAADPSWGWATFSKFAITQG